MKRKILALVLGSALVGSALAGCSGTSANTDKNGAVGSKAEGTAAEGAKGVIKLGGLAPLTGNYAEYGKGFKTGFEMALEKINSEGGVNGYTFEIVVKDSEGDAVKSSTLATDYAENEEILAILGDFTSGASKANAEIVDRYGIVQLSPTASAPDYAAMSDYCFSIMGRQDAEAPYLAKYILKKYLGVTNVAVIRVDSDWGLSCYENFKVQADKEGLAVTEEKYAVGEKDFSSLITKVKATNPDILVVMDQGDAVAQIFNQADAAGWEIGHVALGPGTSEQVADQLTDKNNLIVTSPFFFDKDNGELAAWSNEFVSRSGFSPTIHPACAYDCVYLIAEAVRAIGDGEVNRDSIRDALANLDTYEGVTGTVKFEKDGDIKRNYMICGMKDGEWIMLEGFEYGADGI